MKVALNTKHQIIVVYQNILFSEFERIVFTVPGLVIFSGLLVTVFVTFMFLFLVLLVALHNVDFPFLVCYLSVGTICFRRFSGVFFGVICLLTCRFSWLTLPFFWPACLRFLFVMSYFAPLSIFAILLFFEVYIFHFWIVMKLAKRILNNNSFY